MYISCIWYSSVGLEGLGEEKLYFSFHLPGPSTGNNNIEKNQKTKTKSNKTKQNSNKQNQKQNIIKTSKQTKQNNSTTASIFVFTTILWDHEKSGVDLFKLKIIFPYSISWS